MPYIKKEDRIKFQQILDIIHFDELVQNEGELNYLISSICVTYLNQKGFKYAVMNQIIGVLDLVEKEFYRRLVAPYENKKIKENGDLNNL